MVLMHECSAGEKWSSLAATMDPRNVVTFSIAGSHGREFASIYA